MSSNLVEIFKAGTHVDGLGIERTFTDTDLADVAAGYSLDRHRAPFLENHDESRPGKGLVKRVLKVGNSLFAEPFQVDDGYKNEVNTGGWAGLSSAFYTPDDPHNYNPGKWSLRHVAAVNVPAIKGMSAPAFSEAARKAGVVAFTFAEPKVMSWNLQRMAVEVADALSAMRDLMIETVGVEKVNAALPSWTIQSLRAVAEEMDRADEREASVEAVDLPSFSEGEPTMPEPLTEDQLATRQAELDQREAALTAREVEAEKTEFAGFCEKLLADGRQFDKQSAIATYMNLGTEPVQFGEVTESPRKTYRDQLTKLPKTVVFGEVAGATGQPPTDTENVAAVATRAREIVDSAAASGRTVSYSEAVAQVRSEAIAQ